MSGLPLKLVVGLGNPGAEYARTRHNAGFWFVDDLARSAGGNWRRESKFQCELARASVAEMLVAHDEIDLPPGVVRLKEGGGHGGHNGVRDVIAQLGADFWRLRIGVGHPGSKDLVVDAVLDRATADEQKLIDAALVRAQAALPELLRDGAQKAMHRLHTQEEQ